MCGEGREAGDADLACLALGVPLLLPLGRLLLLLPAQLLPGFMPLQLGFPLRLHHGTQRGILKLFSRGHH